MKAFVGFSVLFLTMVTALVCFVSYGKEGTSSSTGMSSTWQENNELAITIRSRKLQGNGYGPSTDEGDMGKIYLEDYRRIDPVPSSKASVRPGPIQHGTPLMPYVPKQPPSPPPTRSKPVGFP
ncbi:uncharacterized protein LOC107762507 [Nicotiana tabacum]|uniref:Uncharacterized protein LOC107762507 n=1 Tax=Nicotiana tabacum TaxID=4097 RepID=A0A1S3X9A6_TOBAC|nr:uncharacterized protein LOC104088151 [Nicotiana tomentosiformis]XP_016436353.1 PREDICTED: uncharacterized protein LOC107762507 [Nicotiana tabacum]XP_018623597.1 uncharacterized protein LOC104088151 [Nicotiana tomentosiformis]